MKNINKKNLVGFIVMFILGLILLFVGAVKENYSIIFIGSIIIVISIIFYAIWSKKAFRWKCPNCNGYFEISTLTNIFSINGGVNHKRLKCPSCKKFEWCDGYEK